MSVQDNWRRCMKCEGLFFGGDTSAGECKAGGTHVPVGNNNYSLTVDDPTAPGEDGWRRCNTCQGLFFFDGDTSGHCPAGGSHSTSNSSQYKMQIDGDGEAGWRLCARCAGLWYADDGGSHGACPLDSVEGAASIGHTSLGSSHYTILQST
jgi:hypothetical protein